MPESCPKLEEHLLERVATPLASPENAFADSDNGPDDGGDAIQDCEATLFATVFLLGLLLPRLSVFGHRRAPQASASQTGHVTSAPMEGLKQMAARIW
eukprot:CAMPEP_0117534768 /NCGR_PEP_ID=MMETSP0784-20121206/40583_1 /TAXON_ID=39447 /ORGANISM="" /LENGTH=97 /DNA_ID=CAMNT_0005331261 /DNA_START=184 /DNA_END=475 /DNA_ORIENTATION=-